MSLNDRHPFWGSSSPLGGLTGVGLLIMASGRLAWAITVAGSLFWVYTLSSLTFAFLTSQTCKKFFPENGRTLILTCLTSFFGSLYLFFLWLLCPFAAIEVFVPLLLVPLFCAGSGVFERLVQPGETPNADLAEYVSEGAAQAASLSVLLIAFSVIREPFAYCSLSFPGTYRGIAKIFFFKANSFFPIGILAPSAGALLLLGYFTGLYQRCRDKIDQGEGNK